VYSSKVYQYVPINFWLKIQVGIWVGPESKAKNIYFITIFGALGNKSLVLGASK
jgi:hypothetical protein